MPRRMPGETRPLAAAAITMATVATPKKMNAPAANARRSRRRSVTASMPPSRRGWATMASQCTTGTTSTVRPSAMSRDTSLLVGWSAMTTRPASVPAARARAASRSVDIGVSRCRGCGRGERAQHYGSSFSVPPMSNNAPAPVRNADPDPRVARTTHALGRALIELIQERDYDEITVQHILDRAGVGRATFYAHYRNKDDALHSNYERLFALFEARLV